jgi:hypothetical protein
MAQHKVEQFALPKFKEDESDDNEKASREN